MRGLLSGVVLLLLLVASAAPALAGEVVEFTDGRYLAVRSHSVHGEYVRLDLDRGSFLIIPASTIDTIRRNRSPVFVYDGGGEQDTRTVEAAPRPTRSARGPTPGAVASIGG